MSKMEMRITDRIAHEQWSELIGFQIAGDDVVRITREFYLKHAAEIQAIQFSSALRVKKP